MNAALAFADPQYGGRYADQPEAFGTSITPHWSRETIARLGELLALPFNWDGQNASKLDNNTVLFALDILSTVMHSNSPAPQIFPLPSGGVQFEWHMRQIDLEIEVSAPYEVYVSFEDHLMNREWDEELSDDFACLEGPINRLSNG